MALIVQKYGGTSVGNPEQIRNVAVRIIKTKEEGNKVVVVVSAISGTTDELISLAKKVARHPSERELDMLMSTGEQISAALLTMAIHDKGHEAISFTGGQIGIVTDKSHTKARIRTISSERILKELENRSIVIIAGFQGVTEEKDITTLGRGGSDTTAVALAAVTNADSCEIYTDVDGVYTADPRIVPDAKKIPCISYDEMLEMASLGAKVMQARSIEFAKKFDVEIHVRSSLNNENGTKIIKEAPEMEDAVVRGVTADKNEAKVTMQKVPDIPGIAARIFKTIADANINIDMIIQNIAESGFTDLSFTVLKTDLKKTIDVINKLSHEIGASGVTADENIAKISIIGIGMRSHTGIAAKMFDILATEEINIEMISTSEIKISVVIDESNADKAMKALHKRFKLGD